MRRGFALHGRETIADARFREQITRVRWVSFQLLPQTSDIHVQNVLAASPGRAPHLVHEPPIRQDPISIFRESLQESVLRRGQVHDFSVARDPPTLKIQPFRLKLWLADTHKTLNVLRTRLNIL